MSNNQLPDILLLLLIAMSPQSHAAPEKTIMSNQVSTHTAIHKIKPRTILTKNKKTVGRKAMISLLSLTGLANPGFGNKIGSNEIMGLLNGSLCACIPVRQEFMQRLLPASVYGPIRRPALIKMSQQSERTGVDAKIAFIPAYTDKSIQGVQP